MTRLAPAIGSATSLKSRRAVTPKPKFKPRLLARERAESALSLGTTTTAHAPPIQTKLEIGEPNDEFEKEADAVADHVMRMTDAAAPPPPRDPTRTNSPTVLQRTCAKCAHDEEKLQREAASTAAASMRSPAPAGFVNNLAAARARGGAPLPGAIRSFMEPRFGLTFRDVRIHRDQHADRLTRSVQARAFTVGRDVFFRQGEFQPASSGGRRLIAHELMHVVQQAAPDNARVQRQRMDEVCHETGRYPGNFEHAIVESDYAVNVNPTGAALEYAIPGGGPSGGTGYADIVDLRSYGIYEIKTFLGAEQGLQEAGRYRDAAVNCDATAPWHLGVAYPERVIPFSALQELVAKQLPEYPGVIVYYRRLRRLVPVPVPLPQQQDQRQENERRKLEPQLRPVPVLQQIAEFIRSVLDAAQDAEVAARSFIRRHPEVRDYILATAIGLVVGTIVEDVLSGGLGILDDVATLRIAYALWRVARVGAL